MTPEEIEKATLALQKAELDLERKRLEIEKKAAEIDKTFLSKNTGVLIPAAVTLAAVMVSIGQVWSANISKNKELELSALQHKADADSQERQREREMALTDSERKRELNLTAIRFVTENRQAIFDGTPADQELFGKVIPALFPPEISAPLLNRIEGATKGADREIWQEARRSAIGGAVFSPDGKLFVTSSINDVLLWDAASSQQIRKFENHQFIRSLEFDPSGRELIVKSIDGSVVTWDLATGQIMRRTLAR
jgi:WD40 repeat protein